MIMQGTQRFWHFLLWFSFQKRHLMQFSFDMYGKGWEDHGNRDKEGDATLLSARMI